MHIHFKLISFQHIRKCYAARLAFIIGITLWIGLLPAVAQTKLNIVTTTPGLAAITREIGGSLINVESLASPTQNPHFVDAKPSFINKLYQADLLISIGLDLEIGWLPPLLANARNRKIQPGQPGFFEAGAVISPILDIPTGAVDRRGGDVHPGGNPHFLYNPYYGLQVAQAITATLSRLDLANKNIYETNLETFTQKLNSAIATWQKTFAPYRGKAAVGYHKSFVYLAQWLGLDITYHIEPIPGISPSAKHLAVLAKQMQTAHIGIIVAEPWHESKAVRVLAEKTGANIVRLPADVGANGINTYIAWLDQIVAGFIAGFQHQENSILTTP